MRRRAALPALLGLACGAVRAAAADRGRGPPGPAPAPAGVVAWGATGLWADDEGGALQRLADRTGTGVAAVPPAVVPGGLWVADGRSRLVCWRRDALGAWAVAAAQAFDPPVHALGASRDGRLVLAAHGEQLSLLDAQGQLLRRYDGSDLARRQHGRATVLRHLPQRRSFVVAWAGLGELWEILLDPAAEPIHDGLVHDYRMGEAIAGPGYLGVRRTPLERPLPELGFADARVPWVAGVVDGQVEVVHLDVRRRIARWPLPAALPSAAVLWRDGGERWTWWLPAGRELHRFDTQRWQSIERESMPGTVRALQSLDDALWALTEDDAESLLTVWRAGQWRRVRVVDGEPLTLDAEPAAQRLLVALGRPSRLLMLDAGGELRHEWPLPAGAALQGACWLPPAA